MAGRPYGRATARAKAKPNRSLMVGEMVPASPQCAPKLATADKYEGHIPGYCGTVPLVRDMVGIRYGAATTVAPCTTESGLGAKRGRKVLNRRQWAL